MTSQGSGVAAEAVASVGRRSPAEADRALRTLISRYPELQSVLEQAVKATIYTFKIDEDSEHGLVRDLTDAIALDLIAAYAPIVSVAVQTARIVETSRTARLLAAARLAQTMAERVVEVAAALQSSGDRSADRIAIAASDAALRMASSVAVGGEAAAATAAARVARAVHQATAAKAQERAEAAVLVAAEAAAAAAQVVEAAELEDVVNGLKIFEAATAVRTHALAMCYSVAMNSAATAVRRRSGSREELRSS